MADQKIKLYALSTCGWCKKVKALLAELNVDYDCTDMDLLEGQERAEARAALAKLNPRRSFPTLVAGDEVVVGFDKEKILRCLGVE